MSRNLSNRDHEPKGRAISTADSHTGTGDGITDDDFRLSIINVYSLRSRTDQGDGRQHDFNGEMKIKTEAIDEDSSQGEVGSKMAEYYQRNMSTAPHKALHSAHVKEEPCDSPQESGSNVCTPDKEPLKRAGKFFCLKCSKYFQDGTDFQLHLKKCEDDNLYQNHKCRFCNFGCDSLISLQAHMKIHPNDCLHECPICGQTFTLKIHYQAHELYHTVHRPYNCPICGNKFKILRDLQIHRFRKHGRGRHFKCSVCGEILRKLDLFQMHMQIHTSEPFNWGFMRKSYS